MRQGKYTKDMTETESTQHFVCFLNIFINYRLNDKQQ